MAAGGPIAHLNLARSFRGGERQTELLIRGLAELGYTQRLIARRGAPLLQRLQDLPGLELRPVQGLLAAARACSRDSAVLHVHEGRSAQAAWWAALRHGPPYLITRRVEKRPKRDPVTRSVYRTATRVVAISRAIATMLAGYEPALRVEVIPSALAHLDAQPETAARLRARHAGRFLVGQIGALEAWNKGQGLLVEVARRVQRTHPDLHFILVGTGPDEALLRARAGDLGNLELTGFVDDVGSYLAIFDLVVLPSRAEGLGSVLLDAMDHGKPIVATRVGGIPELVSDGDNGLLIAPGSADELQCAILALYADRARLAAMGARGRTRAALYTPARMVAAYSSLYRSVLEKSG